MPWMPSCLGGQRHEATEAPCWLPVHVCTHNLHLMARVVMVTDLYDAKFCMVSAYLAYHISFFSFSSSSCTGACNSCYHVT